MEPNLSSDFIKSCRTCGIFIQTPGMLRTIFVDDDAKLVLIRKELATWQINIQENDGYSQYICTNCIYAIGKAIEIRVSCINTQDELRLFHHRRTENLSKIQIKKELDVTDDINICDFVYVDDNSDFDEEEGITPFSFPHRAIKEELSEDAVVPIQTSSIIIHEATLCQNLPKKLSDVNIKPLKRSMMHDDSAAQHAAKQIVNEKPSNPLTYNLYSNMSPTNPKVHADLKDLNCHICDKVFGKNDVSRLKLHLKYHKVSKHIKCALCNFHCTSRDTFIQHTEVVHDRAKCIICNKYISATKINVHMRDHKINTDRECFYCSEVFTNENDRERHIWQVHASIEEPNDEKEEVNPNSRSEAYTNDNNRYQHIFQEDTTEADWRCAYCNEAFTSEYNREQHIFQVHADIQLMSAGRTEKCQLIADWECAYCNEVFSSENDQEQHMNVHAELDVIGRTKSIKFNANQLHARSINNNVENHKLMVDDNIYRVSSRLYISAEAKDIINESQSVPTSDSDDNEPVSESLESESNAEDDAHGMQNYKCAECYKTFNTLEQLRTHHVQHAKSMFACQLCGKRFELKFGLNRHLKKHSVPF